jgi:hypothetical protein
LKRAKAQEENTMGWETFNAGNPNKSSVGDGQCQFTKTITNNVLKAGAQFQYSPSAASPPPNPTTVFTTGADIPLNGNNVYSIPDTGLPPSFNIPPKGQFSGGNYTHMVGATYNPTTNALQGTFNDAPAGDVDDCDWSAQGGSK